MKIKDWLTKERWIQHTFIVGLSGGEEGYCQNPKIEKTCLLGAIWYCYPEGERLRIFDLLLNKTIISIDNWNDNATWEEVQALVEELDI